MGMAVGTTRTSGIPANGLLTVLFSVAVIAIAMRGYELREEFYLAPDHGLGYALGIVGGLLMLMLLLYPLRKNVRLMHNWGPVRHWFRMHMLLGIIGPLLVLFHCNFSLGAVNSNMALLCMVMMVSSGMVGRFIFTRIHYGLYGEKANLQELQRNQLLVEAMLRDDEARYANITASRVVAELKALQPYTVPPRGPLAGLWRVMAFAVHSRRVDWKVRTHLRSAPAALAEETRALSLQVERYIDTVRRLTGFSFFERLFSLWHVLHMPIFFMLMVTGLVHVWAVHNY